jgi:hypothetical protein
MRYKKDAIKLVSELYSKRKGADIILESLVEQGFRKRSRKSVEKLIVRIRKEKQRASWQKWARNNPEKYRAMTLVSGAKTRAKQKGIPFNLTVEYIEKILKNGVCQVTGLKFDLQPYEEGRDTRKKSMHAPSLDQIEPSKGYTICNVQVVVYNYNTLKSCGTAEEALITAKALVARYAA